MSLEPSRRQILKGGLMAAAGAILPAVLTGGAGDDRGVSFARGVRVRKNVNQLSRFAKIICP